MCKSAVAIFKFWISISFLSRQDDLCHILFLSTEEQLLLCHQLEIDGGLCVCGSFLGEELSRVRGRVVLGCVLIALLSLRLL